MQYQYFIASSSRNSESITELTQKIREKNKSVYSFLETNPLTKLIGEEISVENWRDDPRTKLIFEKNIHPLKNSKALILLLPAGKSAHIESGIAYGMGKKCILIGDPGETDSLYLIFNEVYTSVDDFIKSLK